MFVNFEKHFSKRALLYGKELNDNFLVDDISVDKDIYSAMIFDSDDHDVSVIIHNGNFINGKCDCSYASSGHNCEHMAALLYAINDEEKDNEDIVDDNPVDLLDIIKKIDRDKINDFLYDVLVRNVDIYNDFRIKYSEYFSELNKKNYEYRIERDIESCCDHYGHIIDENIDRFEKLMDRYICEASDYFERKDYVTSYVIVTTLIESMIALKVDSYYDVISYVTEDTTDILCEIVDYCDDQKLLRELFNYLKDELLTDRLYDNVYVDLSVLLNHFIDKGLFLDEIEETINEILKSSKEKDIFDHFKKYVDYLCELYGSTGRKNKILPLLEEYSFDTDVCLEYIDELINKKQVTRAIEFLKNKILENERDYDNRYYAYKLAEIYKANGMNEEYKNILIDMFLLYNDYDFEVYKKIKELYPSDKWDEEKLKLISAVKKDKGIGEQLNQIYIEENMIDELFDNVKDDINKVVHYENYFLPKYNKELQEIYKKDLLQRATRETGRGRYSTIAGGINHLIKMDDSFETVSSLLKEIKQKYFKKRPVMEEEFYRKIKNMDEYLK